MSVKLTKSPTEQQPHNYGLQLNANQPLSHNSIEKTVRHWGSTKL